MHKKGVYNLTDYIIYIIFSTIVAVFIVVAIHSYLNEEISTTNLETFLLVKKLTYSESCLAYKDDTRVHQGKIDLQRLGPDILANCFTKSNLGYSVKVSKLNGDVVKTASNLNSVQKATLPICKTVSGYECFSRRDLVLYNNQNKFELGYMDIEVINFVG